MEQPKPSLRRCAIYTRKSSEEGLEQAFNSLQAQREACEAFIRSQAGEGWRLLKTAYDDGGLSGGTMERPALQRMLADINRGLIDVVVVYKVDRLTRSLSDFARIIEIFDARAVSFVAVTQQFNTTTSMGRLTLNVLLSFAQFEREVTGERIRDKIAASKKKGMWMGGLVPLGYDVHERHLIVNESEAEKVRGIFRSYGELGCVRLLMEDLNRRCIRSKRRISRNGRESGGNAFSRGALYELLSNPIYIGEIRHKGARHPGLQEPIIDRELWEKTQLSLRSRAIRKNRRTSKSVGSPLTGKLFDENGSGLTPSHAVKGVRRYRYYVSRSLLNGKADLTEHGWRVPAPEIEKKVAGAACQILSDRTEIASAVEAIGLPDNQLPSVFTVVDQWRKRLLSEIEAAAALNAVVDRVELSDSGFRLALKLPMTASGRQAAEKLIYLPITRVVPMKIKRRGVEMRLIMNGNNASIIKADSVLLKTIARAYHWAQDLMSGRMLSVEELAEHHQIGPRYVRRLLQVAFLAPKIVEGIAAGTQPQDLTAEALVERMRLPLLWTEQEQTVFAS